jgi:hypothetical protein
MMQVLDAAKKLRLAFLEEEEESIILKAIMDVNLPKFSSSDVPLFQVGLIDCQILESLQLARPANLLYF